MKRQLLFFTVLFMFLVAFSANATTFSFDSYTGGVGLEYTDLTDPDNPTTYPAEYGSMDGEEFTSSDIDYTLGTYVMMDSYTYDGVTYIDQVEMLRGHRTFEAGTTNVDFNNNMLQFVTADYSEYDIGEEFLLGTLTFTNGVWFVDPEGAAFSFTITASSNVANLFDQVFSGTLIMHTNRNFRFFPERENPGAYF